MPNAARACTICEVFLGERIARSADGQHVWACWICAHALESHGRTLRAAAHAPCGCTPEQVYPAEVRQHLTTASGPVE